MVRPGLQKHLYFQLCGILGKEERKRKRSSGEGSSQSTRSKSIYARHRLMQPAPKNIWQKAYNEFFRILVFPFYYLEQKQSLKKKMGSPNNILITYK